MTLETLKKTNFFVIYDDLTADKKRKARTASFKAVYGAKREELELDY